MFVLTQNDDLVRIDGNQIQLDANEVQQLIAALARLVNV
jgi:hypothetical protein